MSHRRIKMKSSHGRRMVYRPNYHAVNENGVLMEDMIMCLEMGVDKLPEGYYVEHINGNKLDNRRSNLELVKD